MEYYILIGVFAYIQAILTTRWMNLTEFERPFAFFISCILFTPIVTIGWIFGGIYTFTKWLIKV
jgi:hypothetical protein